MTTTKFQIILAAVLGAATVAALVAVSGAGNATVTLTVMGGNATAKVTASSINALPKCATESDTDCVYISDSKTFVDLDGTAYLAPIGYFN